MLTQTQSIARAALIALAKIIAVGCVIAWVVFVSGCTSAQRDYALMHPPKPALPYTYVQTSRSRSMGSLFVEGQSITVNAKPFAQLKMGDIVVRMDHLVLHRIVEREAHGFITQGDANLYPDRGIMYEEGYLGVVAEPTHDSALESLRSNVNPSHK